MKESRMKERYGMITHPRTTASDGCSLDTARAQGMRSEADWAEMRDFAIDMQRQRDALSDKLKAITKWLEKNQADVFRRGLWDAVEAATSDNPSLCWRCSQPNGFFHSPCKCGAINPNVDLQGALAQQASS